VVKKVKRVIKKENVVEAKVEVKAAVKDEDKKKNDSFEEVWD